MNGLIFCMDFMPTTENCNIYFADFFHDIKLCGDVVMLLVNREPSYIAQNLFSVLYLYYKHKPCDQNCSLSLIRDGDIPLCN